MKGRKAIGVLMCACLLLGVIFPTASVVAKPVEGIIKDVVLKNDQGYEPETMTKWPIKKLKAQQW